MPLIFVLAFHKKTTTTKNAEAIFNYRAFITTKTIEIEIQSIRLISIL